MEAEFEAVKKIMDALVKHWPQLSPDTKAWLKSRMSKLPTDQVPASDEDRERV